MLSYFRFISELSRQTIERSLSLGLGRVQDIFRKQWSYYTYVVHQIGNMNCKGPGGYDTVSGELS